MPRISRDAIEAFKEMHADESANDPDLFDHLASEPDHVDWDYYDSPADYDVLDEWGSHGSHNREDCEMCMDVDTDPWTLYGPRNSLDYDF
jgi:hypothetical protein